MGKIQQILDINLCIISKQRKQKLHMNKKKKNNKKKKQKKNKKSAVTSTPT